MQRVTISEMQEWLNSDVRASLETRKPVLVTFSVKTTDTATTQKEQSAMFANRMFAPIDLPIPDLVDISCRYLSDSMLGRVFTYLENDVTDVEQISQEDWVSLWKEIASDLDRLSADGYMFTCDESGKLLGWYPIPKE